MADIHQSRQFLVGLNLERALEALQRVAQISEAGLVADRAAHVTLGISGVAELISATLAENPAAAIRGDVPAHG